MCRKKVLTAEEKEKKRQQEQILKNRQMSKNARQRKEQRFAMLEKELSKIQEELKHAKALGADSTTETVNAFGTLLQKVMSSGTAEIHTIMMAHGRFDESTILSMESRL